MTKATDDFEMRKADKSGSTVWSIFGETQPPYQPVEVLPTEGELSEKHISDSYFLMLRMGFPHTAAAIQNIHKLANADMAEPQLTQIDLQRRKGCANTLD